MKYSTNTDLLLGMAMQPSHVEKIVYQQFPPTWQCKPPTASEGNLGGHCYFSGISMASVSYCRENLPTFFILSNISILKNICTFVYNLIFL